MTNGEHIRSMDDKDLAGWIGSRADCELCPASEQCGLTESCQDVLEGWLGSREGWKD